MRKTALIFLADGCEEIEAVTPIDLLRRAGVEVTVAGVGKKEITASRGLKIVADILVEDYQGIPDAVVVPGGKEGAENLRDSKAVQKILSAAHKDGRIIAAICASPAVVLLPLGILQSKNATCYPGYQISFGKETSYQEKSVVRDGQVLTSRGPGTSMEFSFELAKMLVGEDIARKVTSAMLVPLS